MCTSDILSFTLAWHSLMNLVFGRKKKGKSSWFKQYSTPSLFWFMIWSCYSSGLHSSGQKLWVFLLLILWLICLIIVIFLLYNFAFWWPLAQCLCTLVPSITFVFIQWSSNYLSKKKNSPLAVSILWWLASILSYLIVNFSVSICRMSWRPLNWRIQ